MRMSVMCAQGVDELLKGDMFRKEVAGELKRSREDLQVTGVPTFIINGKTRFSGGRAPDFFLMSFHRMGYHTFNATDFESSKL